MSCERGELGSGRDGTGQQRLEGIEQAGLIVGVIKRIREDRGRRWREGIVRRCGFVKRIVRRRGIRIVGRGERGIFLCLRGMFGAGRREFGDAGIQRFVDQRARANIVTGFMTPGTFAEGH